MTAISRPASRAQWRMLSARRAARPTIGCCRRSARRGTSWRRANRPSPYGDRCWSGFWRRCADDSTPARRPPGSHLLGDLAAFVALAIVRIEDLLAQPDRFRRHLDQLVV